jgi:hypothetical protein
MFPPFFQRQREIQLTFGSQEKRRSVIHDENRERNPEEISSLSQPNLSLSADLTSMLRSRKGESAIIIFMISE